MRHNHYSPKCRGGGNQYNGSSARKNHSRSGIIERNPCPAKVAKKKILAIIGIGVLVIAIGAFCLTRFTGSFGGSKNVYQEINFNNGAHFAYDDTRLYFIADYNADDEDESLYSTDYNGGHKTLIADAENIIRIRVIDGKI